MLTLCGVHFLTLIGTFCFLPATFISISSSSEVDDNKLQKQDCLLVMQS